ncbi:transposase [Acetobacterium wieringae]|uniref:Transposase IS200 like protein n=1 Tax=Acetobacterium wieringae TaxID=52694 RepID=A0A1F2PDD1_9FIRM|nr:transposase [Acetobacterium wieringae]OFV69045.1 transposase IS200 like protein [Acetobacterium wieringae]
MPRKAREKSATAVYHVVFRGINRQVIFEDQEDRVKYLELLKAYQEISGFKIYAYCLMSNHIHLVMKEGEEELGIVFRRLGAGYVYWYNWKYNRRGHLFQDRFKSEPVEDDAYLLAVIRYVHQNPVKAEITDNPMDYPWSSYHEYLSDKGLCETNDILSLFSEDLAKAKKQFETFNQSEENSQCLDIDEKKRWKDPEAIDLIKQLAVVKNLSDIQQLDKLKRDDVIRSCKSEGLSIRQIERLTGISFGVVRKA